MLLGEILKFLHSFFLLQTEFGKQQQQQQPRKIKTYFVHTGKWHSCETRVLQGLRLGLSLSETC